MTLLSDIVKEVQNKYSFLDNFISDLWKSWIRSNKTYKVQLKNIKWKNAKAEKGFAYKPTEVEQFANVITHGIWIVPALVATLELFERSKSSGQYIVSWVYGGALIMLFTISTSFHCSCYCADHVGIKNVLHRCDRAMIYVFIAGSYFPWLQLEKTDHSLVLLFMEWAIWILAAVGIAYQQMFHERFKWLETCLYLLMGLGPALVVTLIGGHEFRGMSQLKLGGFFYIMGICFFKSDGFIPMAHAIWHMFVVIAASLHYYAILVHLYPSDTPSQIVNKDEL